MAFKCCSSSLGGLSSEEQRLRAAEERLRDQLGGTLRDLEASLEAALQAGVGPFECSE